MMRSLEKSSKGTNKEVLNQLWKEKEKLEHTKFDDMFDFSQDFNSKSIDNRKTLNPNSEESNILKTSNIDYGMKEVKELKRLLFLTKLKFRQENKSAYHNMPSKDLKIKKKLTTRQTIWTNKEKFNLNDRLKASSKK